MDEIKLVYTKDEFDIIMHDDGHVDISAGDKLLMQIPAEEFNQMVQKRAYLLM